MPNAFHVGAAAVNITPPLGVSLAGSYGDRKMLDVRTELMAKALVLDDGATEVALVILDLCWLPEQLTDATKARITTLTGIQQDRVMLSCTHTHSGPVTQRSAWYEPDAAYLDVLVRKAADAVALARQRKRVARVLVGQGVEDSVAFNRRYWMADGTVRTNPRYQDPAIVRRAGPIDPAVGVVRFEDVTGQPIALLVNYALHVAVVGGTAASSDYPGALSEIIRKLLGPDVVVLFATGCCGDVNHVDYFQPGPQMGQDLAERIGAILAAAVAKVSTHLQPVSEGARLRFAQRTINLALRQPTPDEAAWAQERSNATMREMDAAGLEAVKAHRILRVQSMGRADLPSLVQALTLGDFALVTLPGEIFVELGLALKETSPFRHTLVTELNGTAFGYIPTARAYDEGGYEVMSSLVAPGSGEQLVDEAIDLLTALRG